MAAIALSHRSRGRTAPNPNVGCIMLDAAGRVVGRGWTQPGGRPHAEAMALAMAGASARGGTAYVSLEPCAHQSARGPCCSNLLVEAGVRRVVVATGDPDPRTNGRGIARLRDAGLIVDTLPKLAPAARAAMAGFFMRQQAGRPQVTLKLATSLDGCIALEDGTSQWITGPAARAHTHLERARHELILVGRGTLTQDQPRLDVRLPGLEARSPVRVLLSHSGAAPDGWLAIQTPAQIAGLPGDHLMVEGGAQTAGAFLAADLVDRLLLYRAPILIGRGKAALGDIGLDHLAEAHGRWRLIDARNFAPDRLEVYERVRPA
ncbi:diaminohydroxyphosphoribosylaminopyrimidine deaminase/5-amino-6-(5-phosphoribosylamino)uracil reductase [Sphingobium sp. B2D3A]|uniref:bifunctional diaminohydroxyphosphoribosylaminopyrimidine deaminase/5-amino-6-(5-phosphoribosylamino)uracil reductase RibD n=1 Tax=unclassified Sphingobium TaxID=2611147 RepID=UPI002224584E|nr:MULTISPECIES: bifunctional diaminohydroxyphosphoribosylaminopyrimidine deaminase/5-amino-6-(5-phosphoribosylamino)uracil reductase RibD [unclassified Sphingobium]MCW2336468.1 diaminohydroxyphosphoribosylaminopyrimidine deaminase/5-amino-6-(5-phosphoribosylamino)uracil reductase [Sphingobium sp. B2D3A]MCW2386222.1 diaminohydroxyphosphoribosylaminopyrimidine deaminase/5-amino-6-(5-phosphoribosylamino)uracil reductase [Sphingobium sp. B2D3D]